jgi:excinuclease UvrABC ATPase subunit
MTEERSCCGHAFQELIPQFFSFNSPMEMCNACNGIGQVRTIDENKMIQIRIFQFQLAVFFLGIITLIQVEIRKICDGDL